MVEDDLIAKRDKALKGGSRGGVAKFDSQINELQPGKQFLQEKIKVEELAVVKNMGLLKSAQNEAFVKGASLIQDSIGIGFAKAANTISKAIASGVSRYHWGYATTSSNL